MFHDRRRYVNARVWKTEMDPELFPELSGSDGLAVPWLGEKRNFGVAFSGGGTRSASATLGQLRGLRKSGLLDKVRYISAVSGGSWAATPYTYLPEDIDDDVFLGEAKEPEALAVHDFEHAEHDSLARAISDSVIADNFLWEALRLGGDETYARAIGGIFLRPFNLDDRERFFTFHKGACEAVLEANRRQDDERHYLEQSDFYTVRDGRPYLVVGATILRLDNTGYTRQKMQCEYTPLYTGVRQLFPKAGRGGAPIGGGYVESFAYDSEYPESRWDARRWRVDTGGKRHRFTLSDVIGSSGAAPKEWLESRNLPNLGFPEFRHWPVHQVGDIGHKAYGHGDGGHLENLGLMPLLARSVKRIIAFVNCRTRFEHGGESYSCASSLEPLFRPVKDKDSNDVDAEFMSNRVFVDDGKFDALIEGLATNQARDQTLIHCDTYTVVPNSHYRIKGGYEVNVCWIYNEAVKNWTNALNADLQRLVAGINNFPHYETFFQNPPKVIDLSVREVNALAHLSCWNVTSNATAIGNYLGL